MQKAQVFKNCKGNLQHLIYKGVMYVCPQEIIDEALGIQCI